MSQLTREVRFHLVPPALRDQPVNNSWAGWPSVAALVPYAVLQVTVEGKLQPETGYLCNIKLLDHIVRDQVVPSCRPQPDSLLRPDEILNLAVGEFSERLPSGLRTHRIALKVNPLLCFVWNCLEPTMIFVTQQFEFSASHRLHNPKLSEEENWELYGKCNRPNGHGHNYFVDVTVGLPDSQAANFDLGAMEQIVKREVIDRLDHTHLNLDIEVFSTVIPTVENITRVIYDWLQGRFEQGELRSVRVYETPKTWAEVCAETVEPLDREASRSSNGV